ncbi:MAG TPA: ABC transporter ATP-binding protein [Caulobacteraceae bacterium]|jgi:putative ABC transport system ATP-binding protein
MLELVDIVRTYGSAAQPVAALRDVSFRLKAGGFCAVLGPSGSGKSTLMNIIGLLDRPTSGKVFFDGAAADFASPAEAARFRNRMVGFVFQAFHLMPRLSAWQNVALPLLYRGADQDDRRRLALAMLELVGLGHRAEHRPAELSGGESQRVALARALVGRPRLVLADEPTGSLDSVTAGEVIALLKDLNRRMGVTILMVTHDRDLADRCDRRIEFLDGRVVLDTAA